jgi:RNA polymerase I-specific transcription initiation factor RRN3
MLLNILRLIPKSTSDLFPIMSTSFPFFSWNKEVLVWYVKQCFQVLDYLPSIRQRLLELLIDKCLEIDVNIFIKDSGEAILDEVEKDSQTKEKHASDETTHEQAETKEEDMVDNFSDKLDAILVLLFEHIKCRCERGGMATQETFHELLPIFESSILTTHKSKFVQYCMFLSCGMASKICRIFNRMNPKDPMDQSSQLSDDPASYDASALYREFVSKLLDIVFDPYRATTTRQSGACYLASFISRAAFVSSETICESVSALLSWTEAYIESLGDDAIRASDARTQSDHHSLFYTVCQAALYMMCFRGQEAIQFYRCAVARQSSEKMMKDDDERSCSSYPELESIDLSSKRWTFLCGHQLQPLRFCLESVRSEFLHVALFFDLIEESVLDKLVADAKRLSTGRVNKKAASVILTAATLEKRRQTGGVGGLGRGSNPLKSFFPFDPLLLRQSHEYIEPFYRYWQGPVAEEDVLVIDEGNGYCLEEPAFEMDETLNALPNAADETDETVENEDSDGDDISITQHSERASVSDGIGDDEDDDGSSHTSPEPNQHKLLQQKAWTETLKRPRSYSMENGSW